MKKTAYKYLTQTREGTVFQSGRTDDILTEESLSNFYNHTVTLHKNEQRYFISLKRKNEAIMGQR